MQHCGAQAGLQAGLGRGATGLGGTGLGCGGGTGGTGAGGDMQHAGAHDG